MNHQSENSLYNNPSDTTIRINSENDLQRNQTSELRTNNPTTSSNHNINNDVNTSTSSDSSTVQQNLLSFLNEARSHLGVRPISLQAAPNSDPVHHHHNMQQEDSNVNRWRVNLNNVLSFSAGPSTETIRSWIPRSGTFRYVPSSRVVGAGIVRSTPTTPNEAAASNDVVINFSTLSTTSENNLGNSREQRTPNATRISIPRRNSAVIGENNSTEQIINPIPPNSINDGRRSPTTPPPAPPRNPIELDEDNLIYELAVKVLSHFVRYLPFIGIVLLKSIFDHWLGIIDILVLHTVVYQANKSVCEQVSKMSQKSLGLLFRDFLLVTFVLVYRFIISHSQPDYLGLLLNTSNDPHSLGQLIHAVAVNDLILKLLTINVKIFITALPMDVIKHKPRGRLFALVEAISQMYRSLVPVKSWMLYLLVSYTGLDIIVGMFFFSSLYMGAKAFEFVERGKFLKKSFCSFIRNVDYGRQPTKEELIEAGSLCPICHDNYETPVILECNHVFCEVCVGTWFKREQTCPMCRAKVADDPTWQNGSTTLFYQLC